MPSYRNISFAAAQTFSDLLSAGNRVSSRNGPTRELPARVTALRLNVAVRSNDAMWGFSGINAFEWSALQEMLAHWLGATVGPATYLATSFHLYEIHVADAEQIVSRFHGVTAYDYVGRAAFAT